MWQFLSALSISSGLWLGGKLGLSISDILLPEITLFQASALALGLYISVGGYYTFYLVYKTAPRDLR